MNIHFTKMHGLGNDFMVLDGVNQKINLLAQQIAQLAHRNTGIGFDQCLLIEPATTEGVDFTYRIFNANGQEVGQCGNGARCLALFAKHYELTKKKKITVATKSTTMDLTINDDDSVSVDMGKPKLAPQDIPFLAEQQAAQYVLEIDHNTTASLHAISVGNPHAVLLVQNLESAPVAELGRQISIHPRFPQQTNTGFMQIISHNHLKLRVYERGCGETLACGSGAAAAAAIGRLFYNLAEHITVSLPGGDLVITWPHLNGHLTLTGPATFVYEGRLI
ncbi:diaminopimelate epimerase [Legionella worsleiensis]|uniref:Diaminopimelate epimerase n=1 Tax=Legionella worsleiensis TaxID=45076 RepID=A0A0W1AK43_9GAMM|nr:diaminopimelate epimerase [Legionella worsleiensis]KTD81616.1 diaminopimelate epimerase [Legionella worsleiensis]STY31975.1 diaminopimelate epimerase [Legionella worsleiensis]